MLAYSWCGSVTVPLTLCLQTGLPTQATRGIGQDEDQDEDGEEVISN